MSWETWCKSGYRDDEPEGKVCERCEGCGEAIHEGDDYYIVDGIPYCTKCVTKREAVWEGDDE